MVTENTDHHLNMMDYTIFKADHADYSGMSDDEKRRTITSKLRKYNVAVNTAPISKNRLKNFGADGISKVRGKAILEGITFVKGIGGSGNRYAIRQGFPVVFDITDGRCVTGLNPEWDDDEYYMIGVALEDHGGGTLKDIPVRLIPRPPDSTRIRLGVVTSAITISTDARPGKGTVQIKTIDSSEQYASSTESLTVYNTCGGDKVDVGKLVVFSQNSTGKNILLVVCCQDGVA